MIIKLFFNSFFVVFFLFLQQLPAQPLNKLDGDSYDICVYGGTSAGVMAAVAAQRSGKKVLLIEPKRHVGGLTAGGLGSTDIGIRQVVRGLARDFYRRVGKYYGQFEYWTFEPHVAERIFVGYLKEGNIPVLYAHRVIKVKKKGGSIEQIVVENVDKSPGTDTRNITSKVFIDASYEGDLMAKSGVSYTFGRESNQQYGETKNGVQPGPRHQFIDGIDPYRIPGDPSSGVIWGVSDKPLAPTGSADKKIQAYCFRICLSADPANQLPITRPLGYDSAKYELLVRQFQLQMPTMLQGLLIMSQMPNSKTDINSGSGTGMSTDYIMGNWDYPDADYSTREAIWKDHELYTRGLLYFLASDARVPEQVREEMKKYGYPKDEYIDNKGFTHELYIREARRLIGEYVVTEHDCLSERTVRDGIAFGSYNMDAHHAQTVITTSSKGIAQVKNEGEVTVHLEKEYPIAYRSLTPKREECQNLLVPVCLSASHIAYGSIRMEPVFMALGQAAGIAASLAIDEGRAVQQISVGKLQDMITNEPTLDNRPPDVLVDYVRTPEKITTEGAWEVAVEKRWDSQEKYLYSDRPGKRRRAKFLPEFKFEGDYDVFYYNPTDSGKPLRPGEIPIRIQHAAGSDTVKVSLFDHRDINTKAIPLGRYHFKPNSQEYVEVIADGVTVPVQASYIYFVPNFKK